jgi:hypothetical protein
MNDDDQDKQTIMVFFSRFKCPSCNRHAYANECTDTTRHVFVKYLKLFANGDVRLNHAQRYCFVKPHVTDVYCLFSCDDKTNNVMLDFCDTNTLDAIFCFWDQETGKNGAIIDFDTTKKHELKIIRMFSGF